MQADKDPILLQTGWKCADSVATYLTVHGWSEVKKDIFLLIAQDWKVTADLHSYPSAFMAIHNPVGGVEGSSGYDMTKPEHQEAFASEIEFWRRCADPDIREMVN